MNIVVVLDQEGRLIWHQSEIYTLPHLLHLVETYLNVELFGSPFSNIYANFDIFHESHIKHFAECESFGGSYVKANFFRYLVPMARLHSFLPKCDHKRNFRFELIELSFDCCCYFKNGVNISFFEETSAGSDYSDTLVNKLFSTRCVKILPLVVKPLFNVDEPVVSSDPKVAVRSELFDHTVNLVVVCSIHIKKVLARIKFTSLLLQSR